ncbi:MAG: hypothetical protein R2854_28810 [Caldilineaceae bacterium]
MGIFQRPERVVLLVVGLLFGWIVPVLWILAVFTNITALQRIYEVFQQTKDRAAPAPPLPIEAEDQH